MAAPEVELALDDIRSAFGAFAKSIKAGPQAASSAGHRGTEWRRWHAGTGRHPLRYRRALKRRKGATVMDDRSSGTRPWTVSRLWLWWVVATAAGTVLAFAAFVALFSMIGEPAHPA